MSRPRVISVLGIRVDREGPRHRIVGASVQPTTPPPPATEPERDAEPEAEAAEPERDRGGRVVMKAAAAPRSDVDGGGVGRTGKPAKCPGPS